MINNFNISKFEQMLKKFLSEPIDKSLDYTNYKTRAKEYAKKLNITIEDEIFLFSDKISKAVISCLLLKELENEYQEFTEIRHPISNAKINFELFTNSNLLPKINNIKEIIINAYFEFANEIVNKDHKSLLILIYRHLLDKIYLKLKEKYPEIAKFIYILPSDTRIPDHSIF